MRCWLGLALALVLAIPAAGCALAQREESYAPDRHDYLAFRATHPDLLEPNYLPFMVHLVPGRFFWEDDLAVFCRWPDELMPLPVHIGAPRIAPELQDEFHPKQPEAYVRAVERALATWERELEGLVRFRQVEDPGQARLELVLVGGAGPEPDPDTQVLGRTQLRRACRVDGGAAEGERLPVRFGVPRLSLFVADRHGLLHPDQVEWLALHEIGHSLGMRFHSPIPADLMYEIARERVHVRSGLSIEDVNSFVSLYQLENGTVFTRLPRGRKGARPPPGPPSGPPRLALAPYMDPRLGFSVRAPEGWVQMETSMGMLAVDGVTWDYSASLQVIVHRYSTLEDYLRRYGPYYLARGGVFRVAPMVVAGRRSLRAVIEDPDEVMIDEFTFIETGDGRVIVVIADCPAEAREAYRPWFDAALASLEIWSFPQRRGAAEGGAGADER